MVTTIHTSLLIILILASLSGLCALVYYRANTHTVKSTETKPFHDNIVELALRNTMFRKEIITGAHSQVVLMSIPVGGEIGMEQHAVDQTLIFVQGDGQALVNNQITELHKNSLFFVPAHTWHNFKNTGAQELKLFTIYAPAQHKPGTVQQDAQEAYD